METINISFRCPAHLIKEVDEEAARDHRDRTSMLVKIIAVHLENNGDKPTPKKKAGPR
jgi:hypothetical protein